VEVTVLGTGAADGWPNAFCTCASCADARAQGTLRGQASALVDGVLLLDCGPTTMYLAERAGAALDRVSLLLFSHAHPDHCSPAALLFRSWVTKRPLGVVGPADAVDPCREWVAPDAPVTFRVVAAGQRLRLSGYDVRVLAARHGEPGSSLLYDLTGPDGRRLLYATDTGPLPQETVAAVAGQAYDLVLLEETFGDRLDHGTDHLDLATFPVELARLRAVGAIGAQTQVVATHLSHHNPPVEQLAQRLADWGVRLVDDGTQLTTDGPLPPSSCQSIGGRSGAERLTPAPARTLVLGGARSGKSRQAEQLLLDQEDVVYVATSSTSPSDEEWQARVESHRARRPPTWTTQETRDLVPLLRSDGPPLLIDCLTLWLAGTMDDAGAWNGAPESESAIDEEIDALVAAWTATSRRVVAVSNEVGSGIVPDTASGRRFRDLLGRLNATLAARTEDVRLVVAGRVVPL